VFTPEFLIGFFCAFVRASAMLASAPSFGVSVPVSVRVLLAAILGATAAPMLPAAPVPESWLGLILLAGHHAAFGLVLGGCLQMLAQAFTAAGSIADLQIGLSSAQLFNPSMGANGAPLGLFKNMLGVTLIFSMDGHHLIFNAFYKSFQSTLTPAQLAEQTPTVILPMAAQFLGLSLQMALPIIAATFLIDLAAGLINKAVPQTQPFLLALPAKLSLGLLAAALALPAAAAGVTRGLGILTEAYTGFLGAR
jgi:flagellar biosynthetic protein FliR